MVSKKALKKLKEAKKRLECIEHEICPTCGEDLVWHNKPKIETKYLGCDFCEQVYVEDWYHMPT